MEGAGQPQAVLRTETRLSEGDPEKETWNAVELVSVSPPFGQLKEAADSDGLDEDEEARQPCFNCSSLFSSCHQEDEDGAEGEKRYQVSLYALTHPPPDLPSQLKPLRGLLSVF